MTRINNNRSNVIRVLNYLTNGFSVQFTNNQTKNLNETTNNIDINKELTGIISLIGTMIELIKIKFQKYPIDDDLNKDRLITKKSDTEILEDFLRINKPITNK